MTGQTLEADAWAAIMETLTIVGAVVEARHAVEAAHGTAVEPEAITALGDELTRLEDAFGALREIHEAVSKDA